MTNEQIREMSDTSYREAILRARAMTPEEKFLAGPRLFDEACRIELDNIRRQNPEASEDRVQEILREQLRREEYEERKHYVIYGDRSIVPGEFAAIDQPRET